MYWQDRNSFLAVPYGRKNKQTNKQSTNTKPEYLALADSQEHKLVGC